MPELLKFEPWFPDRDREAKLRILVQEGLLPPDILLRLMQIGEFEPDDPEGAYVSRRSTLLSDVIKHASDLSGARPDTQVIVQGPLPDVIVDPENSIDYRESYQLLGSQYWSKGALTKVIQHRRAHAAKTITETLPRSDWDASELERHRCQGLSQPIWRVLVTRLRPDIIEHSGWFYPNATIAFNGVHELGERTIRRNAIRHARISDDALRTLYDEIASTGMKGIGPVGKRDLATMLAPVHPDIMVSLLQEEGIEVPEGFIND